MSTTLLVCNRQCDQISSPGLCLCVALVLITLVSPRAARADAVMDWNVEALSALSRAGFNGILQTRVMAMVHAAIHDAVNAVHPRYERYAVQSYLKPGSVT